MTLEQERKVTTATQKMWSTTISLGPPPSDEQKAQVILDARAFCPDCSLADLYGETAMPPELRKAHQKNDKAVMMAYRFSIKDMTESKCVAELMKIYQQIVKR